MRIVIVLLSLILSACDARDTASLPAAARETAGESPSPREPCIADWRPAAKGIDYRALNCSGDRFDLHLVRVDPKIARVEAKVQSGTAKDVAGDAVFALNANFFDENLRPLGVVRSGGNTHNPLHPVDWQSVFVIDDAGEANIVTVPRWPAVSHRAVTAVQAGPRLVVAGAKNKVAQATPSLRSGVCVQKTGHVLFFATPIQSLFDVWQMVDLAYKGEAAGGMGCQDAMLFDGGPSVQIFVRLPDGTISMEGDPRVPAFIVGRAR